MTRVRKQARTRSVSVRSIVASREFARGLDQVRKGLPFDPNNGDRNYERGRCFGFIAPLDMPLRIGTELNPKALRLADAAFSRKLGTMLIAPDRQLGPASSKVSKPAAQPAARPPDGRHYGPERKREEVCQEKEAAAREQKGPERRERRRAHIEVTDVGNRGEAYRSCSSDCGNSFWPAITEPF
jgi:hypothetical protein